MTSESPYQRPSQDARVAQTRQLVLAAARRLLLEEGQDAVTPTRLAAVTGISRSTIYRNWDDPSDIVFEATATDTEQPAFTPTGDPRTDLIHYLEAFRDMLGSLQGTLLATRIDRAEHNPETAATLRTITADRRDLIRRLLQHPTDDFAPIHALIAGPLMFQRFMAQQPISEALIALIADAYLDTRNQPPTT